MPFLFRTAVIFTMLVFGGLLAMAVVVSYGRPSGNTGLDMAKMQQLRAKGP